MQQTLRFGVVCVLIAACLLVCLFFFCGAVGARAAEVEASPSADSQTPPPNAHDKTEVTTPRTAQPDVRRSVARLAPGSRIPDNDDELPWLAQFPQGGPNDVRDILLVEGGFLVATGTAILRYQYVDNVPQCAAIYTDEQGLPSGNCDVLRRDVEGGIWARCQGGIGYLAPRAERWQAITQDNGLAPGSTTSLALSADGRRVWVASTGGLSTALVADRKWRCLPGRNLHSLCVHPSADIVWCRKETSARNVSGVMSVWRQYDLQAQAWRDIPETSDDASWAFEAAFFDTAADTLWLTRGARSPALYNPKTDSVLTWSRKSLVGDIEVETESDDATHELRLLGNLVPAAKEETGPWFATHNSLWHFDAQRGWQQHLRPCATDTEEAILTRGDDGRTLYWLCDGNVAAYDPLSDRWTELWCLPDHSYGRGQKCMTLSPDGHSLWFFGFGQVFIGQLANRRVVALGDSEHPGLSAATFVRFDPLRKLALIATRQGVVCASYDGQLRFALARPAAPFVDPVSTFVFAPDGSEVWCLMPNEFGFMTATVLFPRANRWEVYPEPKTFQRPTCMAFSPDGKTAWMLRRTPGRTHDQIVQRTSGGSRWAPIAAPMPAHDSSIMRFWPSPHGDELWIASDGNGLIRAQLHEGLLSHYAHHGRGPDEISRQFPLTADNVKDLAFVAGGSVAVCSATGGGEAGITKIDLRTGKATIFSTGAFCADRLVVGPDDRTVWCVGSGSDLRAFDVETESWTHKCEPAAEIPWTSSIETLAPSLDGSHVWVRGHEGAAVYSVGTKTWKAFVGEPWTTEVYANNSLWISPDGQWAVCGHDEGVALLAIDGSNFAVLSPGAEITGCGIAHIVSAPETGDCVCFLSHPHVGGIYYIDLSHRQLREIRHMPNMDVSAMAIGPDGYLWGATPGSVFCIDPRTGEDRADLAGVRVGWPTTVSIQRTGRGDASRVITAPSPAAKARTLPPPEPPPPLTIATRLPAQGMLLDSSQPPVAATSAKGRIYVIWPATNAAGESAPGDLPPIPAGLLSAEDLASSAGGGNIALATDLHAHPEGRSFGLHMFDGQNWRPPQRIIHQVRGCDFRFAWCHDDDLHLLFHKAGRGLIHLVYQPAGHAWKKLAVLDQIGDFDHVEFASCPSSPMVHLAAYGHFHHRVDYRCFDGRKWSNENRFRLRDGCRNVAMAAAPDGTCHLVAHDGARYVTHVAIKDGAVKRDRHDFGRRPIDGDRFAISVTPTGQLLMAYCASLYPAHPDHDVLHLRSWDRQVWSEPTLLPYHNYSYEPPVFLTSGNRLLLGWYKDTPPTIVYSVLRDDGAWSYPLPFCLNQDGSPMDERFLSFHVDPHDRLRVSWKDKEAVFTATVADFDK